MKLRSEAEVDDGSGSARSALGSSGRATIYILASIFLLALGLRVWGISFGMPYDFTPDEVHEIIRALKLGAGEYAWTGGKGGLYYILFVEYGLLFVYWWLTGQVQGATDFAVRYLQDPTAFYLLGRVTVALMGAVSCLVIYAVGKRTHGRWVGLVAAFIGATAYYHAMWSHYINVDTGMTLAIWTSVLAFLKYEETSNRRWLLAAGALVGVAVAFKLPGGIGLPVLLLAIATAPGQFSDLRRKFTDGVLVTAAMFVTIVAISPENIIGIIHLAENFSNFLVSDATAQTTNDFSVEDIYAVTIFHDTSYLSVLLSDYHVVLNLFALAGMAVALWRRNRWAIVWTLSIVLFLTVLILSDRPGEDRYLLPLVPASWLLAAWAIEVITRRWTPLVALALIVIVAPSMLKLVEQNYTWTRPDTRVLAKAWIEKNVPADAKILMDGMQYRFIMSPPLTPNTVAVKRRVEDAMEVAESGARLSRGVSGNMLELYAKAMVGMPGPRYDLHSTVWGLAVEDLDYYPAACFSYVVTSSAITNRFERQVYAESYPESARFYAEIRSDPRFTKVYSVEPVRWRVQGPEITVYRVASACG